MTFEIFPQSFLGLFPPILHIFYLILVHWWYLSRIKLERRNFFKLPHTQPGTLDILFRQITMFIKVCVAFVLGLLTN